MAIKISGSTIIDDSRNIVAGAAATFTGSVSVGGTLTYEDVTNIDSVGLITAREGIKIPFDNKKIQIGASNDLEIYHDSSAGANYIKDQPGGGIRIPTGWLAILSNTNESNHIAKFTRDQSVDLYYNGTKRFETTNTGVSITGTLAATALTGDGSGLTGITTAGGSPTAWSPDTEENLYAGSAAGKCSDANACYNVAIGYKAGCKAYGDSNVFLGECAGSCSTTVNNSIFIGKNSVNGNTATGNGNIAIGVGAGKRLTSGEENIFLGCYAAGSDSGAITGSYNIAFGGRVGCKLTSGETFDSLRKDQTI